MSKLFGLEEAVTLGTKVRVIPSPFDSAPDYVGLTGQVTQTITQWESPTPGEFRTQYRVLMDETPENMEKLANPPTSELGPLWKSEGPWLFILLDHELERIA